MRDMSNAYNTAVEINRQLDLAPPKLEVKDENKNLESFPVYYGQ
jgi:hypothetical protein